MGWVADKVWAVLCPRVACFFMLPSSAKSPLLELAAQADKWSVEEAYTDLRLLRLRENAPSVVGRGCEGGEYDMEICEMSQCVCVVKWLQW